MSFFFIFYLLKKKQQAMAEKTKTQEWVVQYDNDETEWEVNGWEDFVREHDGTIYTELENLGGLTDVGRSLLVENNIENTNQLLGYTLLNSGDIEGWLVKLGFEKKETHFDDFHEALSARLRRAELIGPEEEDGNTSGDDEDDENPNFCVVN